MSKYILAFTALILLSSCSQTFYYVDASPHSTKEDILDSSSTNLNIDVNVDFGGDALDYFVFELDIENTSDQTISLLSKDVFIDYKDNPDQSNGLYLQTLDKYVLLDQLEQEKKSLKKQRRINKVSNIFIIGVGLLGSIFSRNPVYATDVIIDGTSDIILDKNFYKLASEDIEVRIEYVQDWVLEDITLDPGESISYDILFDAIEDPYYCEVTLLIEEENFTFPFDMILREEKR